MIEIRNLTKSFPINKKEKHCVLNDLSLIIEDGDHVGIIGDSGGGKTTLLKCMASIIDYDSGMILYGRGIDIKDKRNGDFRQKVSFVFQNYGLFPNKTVKQNITFPLTYVRKVDKAQADKIAEDLIKSLGLSGKEKEYPNHLSGGQRQRVAIARALAIKPLVMLFDEPTSAIDPKRVSELVEIINKMDRTITIIIVSHSLSFIEKTCNRVAVLENGTIKKYGKTKDILPILQQQNKKITD